MIFMFEEGAHISLSVLHDYIHKRENSTTSFLNIPIRPACLGLGGWVYLKRGTEVF